MKHIGIKTAQIRLIAIMLLIMGTISAHAQYYINISPTVGTRLRYAVSAVDSVWFEKYEQQEQSVNYEYDLNIRQTDGTRLRYAVGAVDSVWFDKDEQQDPSGNYEYVDLGLSVNWATFNVGATAPEEYGDYFAWGETECYYEAGYAQEDPQFHWKDGMPAGYYWSSYKYSSDSYDTMTKYNNSKEENKTTLEMSDDVARQKWGGDWRMPTQAEFKELLTNCDWACFTQNGVKGYKVTSRKDSSRSIFLPAAGYRDYTDLNFVGSRGFYWSSSLNTEYPRSARILGFDSQDDFPHGNGSYYRCFGLSIRPVCPSSNVLSIDSIALSKNELSLTEISSITIYATPIDENGNERTTDVSWRSSDTTVARVDNGNITAISAGTCTITAYVDKVQSTCVITVISGVYEYVDLGLSVKWATCNVGAVKPEDYGNYYAWGETETKKDYSWSTYKYCKGSRLTLTKYCNRSDLGYNGFTDTLTTLLPEDDVAHVKWGGDWRMPTRAEYYELLSNCDCDVITQNGVKGYKLTSRKDSSRSIFLPAAGYRYDTSLIYVDSLGYYWSSLLTDFPSDAWYLDSRSYYYHFMYEGSRCYGFTVRPVCP